MGRKLISYLSQMNEFDRFFGRGLELETPRVLLRKMKAEDLEEFKELITDENTWKYFSKDLSQPAEMESWINEALHSYDQKTRVPFTIIEIDTGRICGTTSYGNISFYDKRIEIGWTWLGNEFIGSSINRHAKFSLLSFAFEAMGMERVEIKTDNLNERAKAALIKVGMKPEGVLRSHMQMHSDRRRDSIYFGMIREEWEERKMSFFSDLM